MKEIPIIFSTEMIRVIDRKTMTRRLDKLHRVNRESDLWEFAGFNIFDQAIFYPTDEGEKKYSDCYPKDFDGLIECPYGKPGDLLYVKEKYQIKMADYTNHTVSGDYLSDRSVFREIPLSDQEWDKFFHRKCPFRATPGRYMYKSLSRHQLKIKNRTIERLQDISTGDIIKEGLSTQMREHDAIIDLERQWIELWNSINKKRGYGWDVNPFVWVIEFEKWQK